LAQDDYYYEIQLTNKQLVFYFLAGATLLISSFLLGVMVGRGVDASGGEVLAAKAVREDRIVPEESPKPQVSAGPDLTYSQRLEADKAPDDLDGKGEPGKAAKPSHTVKPAHPSPSAGAPSPSSRPSTEPSPKASPSARATPSPFPKPTPSPSPTADASPATTQGNFSIQVGAFKDRASADSIVARLKSKGYAAFVVPTEGTDGDLYNVRVGNYASKVDAEKTEKRLRDEEKYKPFIVHP
jgi:DedD protein